MSRAAAASSARRRSERSYLTLPRRRASDRRGLVLAPARLGDDPALAHATCEKNLADRVIDFMCASVQKIFTFKINFRAA